MLALRLEPDQEGGAVERHGRLQLAAGSDPYFVLVDFLPETANEPLRLRIGGGTSPAFIYKRAYPYYRLFVRSGKGECLADQKSS